MSWFWFSLIHVLFMSMGQYFGKIFVHKIHPYQLLFYQYIASITTISIYLFFFKPDKSFLDVPPWLILIGFMYALGVSANYYANKQSLSKTAVMSKSSNLITILLAIIFLGESSLFSFDFIGFKKIAGIILMIVFVVLFYYKKTHHGSEVSFDYHIWIKWISFNILIMGLAKFVVKYAVGLNEPLLVLRLQYIGSFLTIVFLCFLNKKTIKIGLKNILGSLLIGVFISTAMAFLYTALSMSSATQVLPITTIGMTLVVTSLGIIVFKEKFTKKLTIPFIIGILAVILLK